MAPDSPPPSCADGMITSWYDTNRPGFWGTFPPDRGDSRGSDAVRRGRRPFAKDPRLNYDEDSDEEWEDEDPGESLSTADEEEDAEEARGESGELEAGPSFCCCVSFVFSPSCAPAARFPP